MSLCLQSVTMKGWIYPTIVARWVCFPYFHSSLDNWFLSEIQAAAFIHTSKMALLQKIRGFFCFLVGKVHKMLALEKAEIFGCCRVKRRVCFLSVVYLALEPSPEIMYDIGKCSFLVTIKTFMQWKLNVALSYSYFLMRCMDLISKQEPNRSDVLELQIS